MGQKKVAVVTDNNSGITPQQAKIMNVSVIPMPIFIDGEVFYECINLTYEEFYDKLRSGATVSTSQPSVTDVVALWDSLLKEYDEIVHIPMSSDWSMSYQTAVGLAADYNGKVQVVNNQRISTPLKQSAQDAVDLVAAGKSAVQIREILEATRFDFSTYLVASTLKYIRKSGRASPAAAAIGTVLNLKPVFQYRGGKGEIYAKARGMKNAKQVMINAIKKDLETKFDITGGKNVYIYVGYTDLYEDALEYKEEVKKAFPGYIIKYFDPIPLSISCHIGPGTLAIACAKKLTGFF